MTEKGQLIIDINFLKINCKNLNMSYEFDFCADDMDQKIHVMPVPQGLNQSLNVSRFKQENMSSHRKILYDLEHYIQDSKNKQNERIKVLKQKQKRLGDQMAKQQAYKQMKRKQIQEQQKQKLFKQCTFKPKVNDKKGPKRNFNQFLQNQYAHTQKVKDKCEQLKKNIQQKKQKGTYKPKINNNYSRRKQSSESTTVFDRLYSLSEKQKSEEPQTGTFHPVINQRSKNMVREGPVQQILYGDALRRKERGQQILHTNSSVIQKSQKPVNYNNEKYAAQKFIREYFFTLEDLQIQTSFQSTIEYVVFNELLKKLGFVTNEEELQTKASSAQRTLVHDAYQLLEKTKVNARNVCVFLLGLIGIYHINPVNFQQGEQPEPDKQFNLDEVEGRKLQKQFNLFYRNRLSSETTRKSQQRSEGYSFQPNINKQSAEMAQKYRNTMLQQANRLLQQCPELQFKIPQDGVISHTELLVLNKMAKDLKMQKRKEQRYDQQLKECTFKPMTMNSSLGCSKASEYNPQAGYKKSTELYEYYKEVKSKKDSLQASRHQQSDPQCTFKPQINRAKPPKLPQVPFSKQTDETLYRLHKGRQEHEQKNKFFQRGEVVKQRKASVKQAQMPTLILDVNLGEKSDRIVLYRGDENRLDQVAHQFANKHSLDQQSKQKLLQMLKTELENVLSKIDEDDENQQFQN